MGSKKAFIDPDKCRECGKCAQACPYNAIAELVRPCRKSCPVDALKVDLETGIAVIDESKCIQCGACVYQCPFGAISYEGGKVDISSACKMCKMCVRKGQGLVDFVEETKEIDKSLWEGICVYADCDRGKIHRVTFELIGKAKELASVTGHPVYALVIGHHAEQCAEQLRHYGVDKIFVYDHPEFADFRIEPYTAAFCDFIEKEKNHYCAFVCCPVVGDSRSG